MTIIIIINIILIGGCSIIITVVLIIMIGKGSPLTGISSRKHIAKLLSELRKSCCNSHYHNFPTHPHYYIPGMTYFLGQYT